MTRWADDVAPQTVHSEYPRPAMVREPWANLNGLWDYAIVPANAIEPPESWNGKILVPFCVRSALSGVKKDIAPEEALWYRRVFTVPEAWAGQRILLHFGAVDWEATIWVNGTEAKRNSGGYDAFHVEITDALQPGDNELVVRTWDPTDQHWQPRGKQILEPANIWYTAVTSIWQTVRLEPVPETSIENLRITSDIDNGAILLTADTYNGQDGDIISVETFDGGEPVVTAAGTPGTQPTIPVRHAKLWSPDSPHLYDLKTRIHMISATGGAKG